MNAQENRRFDVLVRYRTNSGCNAKTIEVWADNVDAALNLACARVRRMRGVVKIDGARVNHISVWTTNR